jgi:L-ascorbate metabolism protein UlaG (beta-lactamase superfamily)
MKIVYYGHSCFSVQLSGKTLLVDPFISPNPLAAHIDLNTIKADFILVSHGHEDHIADCVTIAKRTQAVVISNWEICGWLSKQGIANTNAMNIGGQCEMPFGSLTMVNAVHSSSFPDGSYAGNPNGFVVRSSQGSFYYSGDTALTMDMQLLKRLGPLSFAALCIGDLFTMGAVDAATAAEWVGAKKVLGLHYDTFPPIKLDKTMARAEFEKLGIELHLPSVGQEIEL